MSDKPARTLSLKRGDTPETPSKLEERLHKVLAQAGLGSRRALEQRIADGLVKVNGETAQVGMSVKSGDRIELDGKSFVASALTEPARVLMYNKPEGEVTTREDPEGRPTIFDALPALKGARWIAIGRLDINTTGLLLLTTDGELANAMMHPSQEVEREYVCRVRPPEGETEVPEKLVDRLRRGVALDDGPAKFDAIDRIGGTDSHDWFKVLLKEGRNREVRRLWESQGCQVSRLKRVRYGTVSLPQPLLRGQSQELPSEQVEALRAAFGLEDGPPPALTLQPVIGQRKAAKATVHVGGERRSQGYVGGHNTADEGRELRRFDNVREDRGRGRYGQKKRGDLTVSGEAAARQSQKPFNQRTPRGPKPLPDGNPAAFRSWYVPEGVDTGPSGHRNAGERPPKRYGKPGGNFAPRGEGEGQPRSYNQGPRPYQPRGEGEGQPRSYNNGPRPYQPRGEGEGQPRSYNKGPRPYQPRGEGEGQPRGYNKGPRPYQPRGEGEGQPRSYNKGPRPYQPRGEGEGQPRGPRSHENRQPFGQSGERRNPRPYGHPGNAPSFPSDHANGGGFNPYGEKPRGSRGPRPGNDARGPRPGGNRPNPGPQGPRGPRPGGNRSPRGGGGGNRGGDR